MGIVLSFGSSSGGFGDYFPPGDRCCFIYHPFLKAAGDGAFCFEDAARAALTYLSRGRGEDVGRSRDPPARSLPFPQPRNIPSLRKRRNRQLFARN